MSRSIQDGAIFEHPGPADTVNFLVTVDPKKKSSTHSMEMDDKIIKIYKPSDNDVPDGDQTGSVFMTRHNTTLQLGACPPGQFYDEACRSKQLVPPRYARNLPRGWVLSTRLNSN